MDKTSQLNLNPIINFIKCLLVVASFATPVFADDKQDIIDTCLIKLKTGDFDSAFPLCIQAAEQGDEIAKQLAEECVRKEYKDC